MSEKSIYKPRPVSGFPEWTPDVRMIEQRWFDHIRRVFESYGFCSIETPSVEELGVLQAKGEVDKEIYVIDRLHKDPNDKEEARLALHFDQTVPLARYVAQHFNDLTFPFKRYQMQRVWRGERPQAGRFREFYQCDIDVINVDALPPHFDAELPAIMYEVMSGLPCWDKEKQKEVPLSEIMNIQVRVSNRKILIGLLGALGITEIAAALRIIDKKGKISEFDLKEQLQNQAGITDQHWQFISGLLVDHVSRFASSVSNALEQLEGDSERNGSIVRNKESLAQMRQGVEELDFVLKQLEHLPPYAVMMDISIVRGLDYYTGTVYETVFVDNPSYGSICSGGRYDDLASGYINKKLPGVGISIGFSRLFAYLHDQKKLPKGRHSTADILVVLPSEDRRADAAKTAQTLRSRGFNVEMYHRDGKIKNQMAYAEKKGIPYVWFPPFDDNGKHEVKNMTTGVQSEGNPTTWEKDK